MVKSGANKMGIMPINRLIITMSLPMMVSMLVQALYNVVDSIFVSQICEDALTAVSMAFPMQMLLIASATGAGVGVNALLSRSLGEKNQDMADKTAINGLFIYLAAFIVFFVVGIFAVKPFYAFQTGNASSVISEMGNEYLTCILMASLGMYVQMYCERLLISTGRTVYTMITQSTGAIINIILDPIMIFGLFGFPELGVLGAAVATVSGQWVAAIMAAVINVKKNHDVRIDLKQLLHPDGKVIKTILAVGIPSMIMQAIGSVMTFTFNKILIMFSSTAVAVFGVYFKLNSIVFMPVFGLNNGIVPIIAYNYGAANRKRITRTIKYGVIYATVLMIIGLMIIELIPDKLLLMFNASENMLAIGVPALRIICLSFMFAGSCIVLSSVFQAFGHGILSMFVSLARQLIVLIPAAYILAMIGKTHGNDVTYVWWSFNIAEIMSVTLSLLFFKHLYNKVISKIPEGDE